MNENETVVVPAEVERLMPGWSYTEKRGDFDMDDGPDLAKFQTQGRLGAALAFLQAEVWPAFDRADKAAIRHQKRHRRLTEVAAVSGSLAVLFGIVQLVFPSLVGWHWLGGTEVVVAAVALLAVILGVKAAFQFNWLQERHRAERLRELKFGLLVHEDLWRGRFDAWQERAKQRVLDLSRLTRADVEAWAVGDRVRQRRADGGAH